MAKTTAHRGKSRSKVDWFAGWWAWILAFAVLYYPAWYLITSNAYNDSKSGMFPWTAAFVLAALGAGVVTWSANLGLRWWSRRANRAARKKQ